MPKFIVKYIETVIQEVVIEADDRFHATTKFEDGDYSEPRIIDAYDGELIDCTEVR